jgi:lactate dehydrogenase-like 2-hydroxyacid dehydrogenase
MILIIFLNNITMKIIVLEHIEMSAEQRTRLEKCGHVEYFNATQAEAGAIVKDADVVIVNWIDPSDFILSMKKTSLIALMSTGYSWIQHRNQARKNDCLLSNIPNYATEAVAEHIIGLILASSRKIVIGDRKIRDGIKVRGSLRGFELREKKVGIIGLGNIGIRVAEILKGFGMEIITYNRIPKNVPDIQDRSLNQILSESDVVCVTCSMNNDSKDMLDYDKLKLLKPNAIVVGTTWGVVKTDDIHKFMKERSDVFLGFDAAFEGEEINLKQDIISEQNIILTPHIAFDTNEALIRQVDICIENIESFIKGREKNIIN